MVVNYPVRVEGSSEPKIAAEAVEMVDADTGQIIYQKHAQRQLPIASITKLLTVAVIHDEIKHHQISPRTKVEITPDIAAISNDPRYSSIGLAGSQSYSVLELLNAAMVKSADGATIALALAGGNSLDEFVTKMNQKAAQLGLKHYHIINPTGLSNGDMKMLKSADYSTDDENQLSANDIAILTQYLWNSYPQLFQVSAQKAANFYIKPGEVKRIDNLNKMLPGNAYAVPGVKMLGLKTGTSSRAGACFVSAGFYRGHRIITVVLHADGDNPDNRFIQTQALYRLLKQHYHLQTMRVPTQLTLFKVKGANITNLQVASPKLTVWSNHAITSGEIGSQLDTKFIKQGRLVRPVKKHQRIGKWYLVNHRLDTITGDPLQYPMYSRYPVKRGNLITRIIH